MGDKKKKRNGEREKSQMFPQRLLYTTTETSIYNVVLTSSYRQDTRRQEDSFKKREIFKESF